MTRRLLSLLALSLILGCTQKEPGPVTLGDDDDPEDTGPGDTGPGDTEEPLPAEPTLAFTLAPESAAVGETVQIDITIENFDLVDPTAVPPPAVAEGEGHVHIYFDGVLYGAVWEAQAALDTTGATAGAHEIELALQDSEHGELEPPVHAKATLTLQ
jgi:hypothetical protein